MAVSSGFFNSVNHDRLYDAEQISSIFDGIINDGIFEHVGSAFRVSAYANADDTVIVGSGRAWFDHTWTLNDSDFSMTLDPPNDLLNRIDTIVIDVNRTEDIRKNSILLVKGTEALEAQPPELINTETHKQYPIAHVTRSAGGNSKISNSDIEILVGTGSCPWVTGPLEVINADIYLQQLEQIFNDWFDELQASLEGNIATNLQNQINQIKEELANAPTGLLSKIVADNFKNDDPGISTITSFTISNESSTAKDEAHRIVTFLPDGKILRVSSDGFRIFTSDGVQSSKPSSSSITLASHLANYQVDAYPVTFNFVTISVDHKPPYMNNFNNMVSGWLKLYGNRSTYTLSKDGVISKKDSGTQELYTVSLPYLGTSNRQSYTRGILCESSNMVKLNDGSYLGLVSYIVGFGNGQSDVTCNDAKMVTLLYKLTTDGVLSVNAKFEDSNGTTEYSATSLMAKTKVQFVDYDRGSDSYSGKCLSYPGITLYPLSDGNIVFFSPGYKAFPYTQNGVYNSLAFSPTSSHPELEMYSVIDSSGTEITRYTNTDVPDYSYIDSMYYGMNRDAKGYVVTNSNKTVTEYAVGEDIPYGVIGGSVSEGTQYADKYFIGASNIAYDIEFGTCVGAKNDGYYAVISPTGAILNIGDDGGTAVFRKNSSSPSIDTSKILSGGGSIFKTKYEDDTKVEYLFSAPYFTATTVSKEDAFIYDPSDQQVKPKTLKDLVSASSDTPLAVVITK